MSEQPKRQLIERLSEAEKEKVIQLLTQYIIRQRKERERIERLKKI